MRLFVRLALVSALLAGALPGSQAAAEATGNAQPGLSAEAGALSQALQLPEVFAIMQEEGRAYGDDLEAEMFPGSGGAAWQASVAAIYSADRVLPEFLAAFDAALRSAGPGGADLSAEMVGFFTSDLGRKAIALEVSARRALLDEAVEDASKLRLQDMQAASDPRLALLTEFITANDLVEANVTGGLNASLAFYQGLAAAGGFGTEMSEEEMLADVWAQEPSIRADTEDWVYSMLAMAYAPLSDDELRAYIAFSKSEAGQRLNKALFAGFDVVFTDVSRRLGTSAAAFVVGQDL